MFGQLFCQSLAVETVRSKIQVYVMDSCIKVEGQEVEKLVDRILVLALGAGGNHSDVRRNGTCNFSWR